MRYLIHITLDTGHSRRSPRGEVDDAAIAAVQDGLTRALARPGAEVAVPGMDGWAYSATAQGRALIVTVWRRIAELKAPVVTFGVAAHSRAGAGLWRVLHQPRGGIATPYATSPDRVPPEPWVAARMEAGVALVDPEALTWIADFERVVGWAWISRGTDKKN